MTNSTPDIARIVAGLSERLTIWVRFSNDGQHIRKWDFKPFEGGVRYIPSAHLQEQKP